MIDNQYKYFKEKAGKAYTHAYTVVMDRMRHYDNGRWLMWNPNNVIERVTEKRAEIGDFETVLKVKWLRTTALDTNDKVNKLLEISLRTV